MFQRVLTTITAKFSTVNLKKKSPLHCTDFGFVTMFFGQTVGRSIHCKPEIEKVGTKMPLFIPSATRVIITRGMEKHFLSNLL
jgi:hypothetical protein